MKIFLKELLLGNEIVKDKKVTTFFNSRKSNPIKQEDIRKPQLEPKSHRIC